MLGLSPLWMGSWDPGRLNYPGMDDLTTTDQTLAGDPVRSRAARLVQPVLL